MILILQKSDINTNLLNRYRAFDIIYLFSRGIPKNLIILIFFINFFSEGEIIFNRFDTNQKQVIQNILEEELEKEIEEKNIICHNPNKQKIMRMFCTKRNNNFKPNNINFIKCKRFK